MDLLEKNCKLLTKKFAALTDTASVDMLQDFLVRFSNDIEFLEKYYSRMEILSRIESIRHQAAASFFLQRAQQWPMGYAGDCLTIQCILSSHNKSQPGTLAYTLEDYFLQSPICEQHRNKVTEQSRHIRRVIEANPAARILSVGCGTSEDLHQCLPVLRGSACRITLVDTDPVALQFSSTRLAELNGQLTTLEANIYKGVRKLDEEFDLIIIGGVFDYLPDKIITAILDDLTGKLLPGGMLFFTNIADGNPYRICMEYLANWQLIERSSEHISSLVRNSAAAGLNYTIEKEKTGLTYLVCLQK
jgi:extracellular factor (EF) 3-hydroxypalmitic acid methyl ester biosynthesis protein